MEHEEIRTKVVGVLATIAPEMSPAALAPDKSLRDQLDMDSVDVLNFVAGLTKTFGIEIPENDFRHVFTIDHCVAYIAARTKK
ncbi:MAG: acyl carrier protein [Burkholderiales bacterium]|jgi:acyl carrier protein